MRHEFVDPKKSTLYLHIPACNVLPSADSYLDVIESPMDLGSIQKALEQGQIHDAQSFVDLTLLVFNNAIRFNMGSDIPDAIHVSSSHIYPAAVLLREERESVCIFMSPFILFDLLTLL